MRIAIYMPLFFWNFRLQTQKWWWIALQEWWFLSKNGRPIIDYCCNVRYLAGLGAVSPALFAILIAPLLPVSKNDEFCIQKTREFVSKWWVLQESPTWLAGSQYPDRVPASLLFLRGSCGGGTRGLGQIMMMNSVLCIMYDEFFIKILNSVDAAIQVRFQ